LRKSVLSEIFSGMVFSNDVHLMKPRKDIFEYALEKYGLIPSTCLFVDDSGRNVLAAKNSRMNALKFKNISQLKKELKGMMVD
jgi:HAD superfamily hydrolase (TIGR01509 family)